MTFFCKLLSTFITFFRFLAESAASPLEVKLAPDAIKNVQTNEKTQKPSVTKPTPVKNSLRDQLGEQDIEQIAPDKV